MRIISTTVFALITVISPITLFAETPLTLKAAGIKTKSAGIAFPPNPRDGCNEAKQNAIEKAAMLGFKGRVVWDHLSSDSDCKVSSAQAGAAAAYTFYASGTFSKQ